MEKQLGKVNLILGIGSFSWNYIMNNKIFFREENIKYSKNLYSIMKQKKNIFSSNALKVFGKKKQRWTIKENYRILNYTLFFYEYYKMLSST